MALWRKLYYVGIGIILLLIGLGELVWVPDPWRWGTRYYWIDFIDLLIYAIALVPLLWMIAALLHFAASTTRWMKIFRSCISLICFISVVIVVTMPKKLEFSVTAMILSLLLISVDMILHERTKRRVPRQSILVFGVTLGLLFLMLWPTNYLVTYPGITLNMNRYAKAQGGAPHGDISGVLIFERPAFPVDWLYAKLFKDYTFEKIETLGMSIGEYNQEVRTMKADANAAGSAIAFHKVGLGKGIVAEGVRITAVLQNTKASEVLNPSDVITALNGQPITMTTELSDRMKAVKPGDMIKLTVIRNQAKVELSVETLASTDDPSRASIGIMIANELRYDIPDLVTYHNYLLHEGGPSHGAMLALTLIDQLTPCGVTNGHHVAGTGTIEWDGSIGPVGGLVQKAYTISRTNADVFFVPVANEADARKGAGELPIVTVRTLDDILNWLKANPKAGAPACTS